MPEAPRRAAGTVTAHGRPVAFWLSEADGPGAPGLVAGLDAAGEGWAAFVLGHPAGWTATDAVRRGIPPGCREDPAMPEVGFATAVHILVMANAEGVRGAAPFLAGLCPRAVVLAGDAAMRLRVADRWWSVDAGMGRGAPLLAGLDAWPHMANLVRRLWHADPDAWAAAVTSDGGARALAAEATGGRPAPALVAGMRDAAAAYAAMAARSPNQGREREGTRGRLAAWLCTAASLPGGWMPRGAAEWSAFVDAMPVVDRTLSWVPADDLPAFLDVRGRWGEWLGRIRATAGVADPVSATVDLLDPAGNLAREVLIPAMSLCGTPTMPGDARVEAVRAAWSLLYSGRTLASCLAASRRIHAGRGAMRAAIALAPGMPSAWDAGMPGMSRGRLRLEILASAGALLAEGAAGPDADGMPGLGHCVGDYAPRCLDGECRIGSIRRVADGRAERLSTVEFDVRDGIPAVAQHRGRGNADPPPEAVAFLDLYMRDMPRPDATAFRPVPGAGAFRDGAGYDWTAPGEWERVAAAWSPFLPRALRGLGPAAWARLGALSMAITAGASMGLPWRRRPWVSAAASVTPP